jgi:hypothetical protein
MPEGRRGPRHDERLLHAIDDGQRRRVAVLDDAQQDRAATVRAHDVLLHGIAVVHLAHVLYEYSGAVHKFDRYVVEIFDGAGNGVGADTELGVAYLRRAGWQRKVLSVDGIDNVDWGQPFGLQLQRVDIDHDLAVFAAGRGGKRDAVDGRQLLPQTVDAVVVESLLIERVGTQPNLKHGNARRVILDHYRRLDPRRHQETDKIGCGHDLRDREIEIDVGLKEDFLNRDTVERLRLDIPDPVHARR